MLATPSRALRALVALFAVAVLVSACGGDDGGKKTDDTEKSDDTKADDGKKTDDTTAEAIADDPCSLIDKADLSSVTGVEFDGAKAGTNSCTYTSSKGGAAIALNFADLQGAPASAALQAGQATCDAGTVKQLDFSDADGGFGCLVKGVATVAATGDGVFAVLTGATIDPSVGTEQILQDLATILEHAITG